jgi:hypothetical protein
MTDTSNKQPQRPRTQQRFSEQLRKIIAQEDLELGERNRRLYKAASKLLTCAAKGEEWAIKELANRLDGRAFQAVSFENPDGTSLNVFSLDQLRGLAPGELSKFKELLAKVGKSLGGQA